MITFVMLLGMLALSVPLGRKIYVNTRRKYLTSFITIGILIVLFLILSALGGLFGLMFAGGNASAVGSVSMQFFAQALIAGLVALAIRWAWDYFHTPTADELANAKLKDPNIGNY